MLWGTIFHPSWATRIFMKWPRYRWFEPLTWTILQPVIHMEAQQAVCLPIDGREFSMSFHSSSRCNLKILYRKNLKKALIWDFNTHIHSSRIPAYIHTSRYLFYRSLMIHYLTYAMKKKLNLTSLFMIVFLSIKIHPITNIYWYHKLLQRY